MATAFKHEPAPYDVSVEPRRNAPGAWTVEAIDDDGGIEQAIFVGPLAEDRANDFARHRYGA